MKPSTMLWQLLRVEILWISACLLLAAHMNVATANILGKEPGDASGWYASFGFLGVAISALIFAMVSGNNPVSTPESTPLDPPPKRN